MIRLTKHEPRWLTVREAAGDDPAVRVRVAPLTRGMKRRAGVAARAAYPDLPDDLGEAEALDIADLVDAITRETVKAAILAGGEWEGIGDAHGKPAPVTPENVDLLLAVDEYLERLDRHYVVPETERSKEGNGSPNSQAGTSPAGTAIAPGAPSPTGAQSAPTRSTRSKASKAKKSGTS